MIEGLQYVPAALEANAVGSRVQFTVNHFLVIAIEVQGVLSWKTHEQEQAVLSVY